MDSNKLINKIALNTAAIPMCSSPLRKKIHAIPYNSIQFHHNSTRFHHNSNIPHNFTQFLTVSSNFTQFHNTSTYGSTFNLISRNASTITHTQFHYNSTNESTHNFTQLHIIPFYLLSTQFHTIPCNFTKVSQKFHQ